MFFLKVSFKLCSLKVMGKLFHSLDVYSIEKCSDSNVFFVVSVVDTGDAKTRLGGGPQMIHWKVARY